MFWTDLHHYGPSLRLIVPYGAAWVPISLKSVFLGTPCIVKLYSGSNEGEKVTQLSNLILHRNQHVCQEHPPRYQRWLQQTIYGRLHIDCQ